MKSSQAAPSPSHAFFSEKNGPGEVFYTQENKASSEIWRGGMPKIFVGTDSASGSFVTEGSTLLWDELYLIRNR